MSTGGAVDGVLVQWGERLFYPRNRIVSSASTPRLSGSVNQRAAAIRRRIQATVVRRAPQVMVKVTGGGRGMAAIAAHLRYISKDGQLEFEDGRGVTREGKEALHDLVEQWRHGGSFIDETSPRREAFNIMLSMPRGTDPMVVQRAAREFAQAELGDHRYVMVLHDHQANPHVHLSVRAESRYGKRLNPRKADLQRWRETFAEKLRDWGIDAEATRQATRGQFRNDPPIWRVKAGAEGRLRTYRATEKSGQRFGASQVLARQAWDRIIEGLSRSASPDDRALAAQADRFVRSTPFAVLDISEREPAVEAQRARVVSDMLPSTGKDPGIVR
ncbi:MAG TPA: conjugal transfer protein TraS [Burkholderiaceae bacterium]